MIHRISKRKFQIYAMDVESHNDLESISKKETSIWLGCFINEDSKMEDESSYFYTIEEFLNRLDTLSLPKRKKDKTRLCNNVCTYIYNLSFEWSFILPVILEKGFVFKEKIQDDDEFCYNTVSTKSVSSVWSIELKFGKKNGKVIFRDLAKIFGGGLDKVAKSFNLPTQKGEIDYRKNRLHDYVVTDEEKEYCFKDTRIIIDILLEMNRREDKDFFNSMSMASYSMQKLLKRGFPRTYRPYKQFRDEYPRLDKFETEFLREGVGGGITYAPAFYQFKDIKKKIYHIDAHQMHPSSAYFNLFPYGSGTYFKGEPPLNRISACRIKISYDDVRLHSVIKLIGLPFITDKEIVVWNFEIPTMRKCYVNIKIEFIDGYAYKMRPLPFKQYYADNYNKRLEAKKNKDDFNILYYKLLNNSSYGKFLERFHGYTFENYVRPDGIIDSLIHEKDVEEYGAKYTYIPVGSCIPAYSRVALIELALKIGYEKIVYFDTDSIFFIADEDSIRIWEEEVDHTDFLGGWALEQIIDRGQFTAPKRYKTEVNGVADIKAGGINFNEYKMTQYKDDYDKLLSEGYSSREALNEIILSYDEVNIISSKWKVQRAYRVKGGTIIDFQEKEIKIPKKYEDIYNANIE